MPPELNKRFQTIEKQRRWVEARACALTDTQRTWKPSAEAWSMEQIVEHLVLSDETVGRAHNAAAVPSEAPMFRVLPRTVRRALVLSAFKRGAVLPLPSPAVEPTGTVPLPELLERWEHARAEMRAVLETAKGSETRWSHPVLGPLTALQMLTLEEAHTAYHTRQMDTVHA